MGQGVAGDFFTVCINGWDMPAQFDNVSYTFQLTPLNTKPNNVGVNQVQPGIQSVQQTLAGLVKRGQGVYSAHNLFSKTGIGAAEDKEFISLVAVGDNKSPVAGDYCLTYDGTPLPEYSRTNEVTGYQKFSVPFRSRGVRVPPFPVLIADLSQITNFTSTPYDDGVAAAGTVNGCASMLQVLTPTGTQATGSVGLSGLPSDNDTYTLAIAAATYNRRWKTAIAAAGDVLIGGTVAASLNNLWQSLVGSPQIAGTGSGISYHAGTTPLVGVSGTEDDVIVSLPGASTITLTAVNTGTGPNAWTLAKSGANLTISGATFSGGVAGETATIIGQSATTSGGSYTTFATHDLDLTRRAAEIKTVNPGTTINRWIKYTITKSAELQLFAVRIAFGRWWPGQR
jgi:hypothetical protein